jgi:hypothetical protein
VTVTATARRLTRELAAEVVGERDDARLVRPVLEVMLRTSIADFCRYYESRHATNRLADTEILMARNRAAKERKA